MSLHKDLTGADLHEPKGVSSATSGQVYQADGAGSGVWSTLVIPSGTFYVTTAAFTSSGTWTKPADLFLAKVTVIGGGGGGGGSAGSGGNGVASSFGSFCSASGGAGGTNSGVGAGGTGSNGDLNFTGEAGSQNDGTTTLKQNGGRAGLSIGVYGTGGKHVAVASLQGSGGGGGATIEYLTAAELPSPSYAVTVGTGGAVGTGSSGGTAGVDGYVLIEEYISVA